MRWAVLVALLVGPTLAGCAGDDDAVRRAPCPEVTPTTTAGSYGGVLLDTRVQLTGPDVTKALSCVLEPNEVTKAVLVAPMDPNDSFRTELAYREAVRGEEGSYLPFLTVVGSDLTRAALDRILREVGLFFRGVWVERLSEVPADVYERAVDADLFIAVPLGGAGGLAKLEAALGRNPKVKILVEATRPPEGLADLVRSQPGLFISIEAPDAGAVDGWLPVIQAAPDRVMWASGVGGASAAAPDAYGRPVANGRAFIGRLPRPMQEPVAAGNARRLMGVPEPVEPDA
ncbi:MAG: hypothetical protein HYU28_12420 [Actinobacteria bacterium]|nr:hypothetical protein [Actinomycetota bacterium]